MDLAGIAGIAFFIDLAGIAGIACSFSLISQDSRFSSWVRRVGGSHFGGSHFTHVRSGCLYLAIPSGVGSPVYFISEHVLRVTICLLAK